MGYCLTLQYFKDFLASKVVYVGINESCIKFFGRLIIVFTLSWFSM